jgi:tRNA pseudouridine38-40 synthase
LRNLLVVLEYDGTDLCGFQRQPNGVTVQQVVEEAFLRLTGVPTRLTGAGRTDAGVHAYAQVVNFSTASRIPTRQWPAALNSALPRSVAASQAMEVPQGFHARKCVKSKTYIYRVLNRAARSPLEERFAHHCSTPLDLEGVRQAMQSLLGKHDFSAFARREAADRRSPLRTVLRADCWREGDIVNFLLQADGFLYRMARSIVGTLIEVGSGARSPGDVEHLLRTGERARAGATAPPQGLFLAQVEYRCAHLQARFGRMFP